MNGVAGRTRVLHVVPDLGSGGGERVAAWLAAHLDRSRYEGLMLSLYPRASSALADQLDEAGVTMRFLAKRPGWSPRMMTAIDRVVRDFRPHVLHSHRYVLRYSLPSLWLRQVPARVHTVHTLAHQERDHPVARWINPIAYRTSVTPVAVSDEVQTSLARRYGLRDVPVIPNGVPLDRYSPEGNVRTAWRREHRIADDAIVIACVARLAPPKEHGLLLDAFARLRGQVARVLLLVGDGPERAVLAARAGGMTPGHEVRVLGARTDVPAILAASDLFVLPSRREGCPLAVIEAMAAGLPVIASAVGGVPRMIEDGRSGRLVAAGDEVALREALEELIADPARRRALGDEARRDARRRFSVEGMTRSYEQLYERLLARR